MLSDAVEGQSARVLRAKPVVVPRANGSLRTVPRVGSVGCGYWGRKIARNLSELGALHAASDIIPAILDDVSREFSVPARSFDALLADPDCDAVAIATPARMHATHVRQALMAGKHVFVEKPLAMSVADGEALVALAADRKLILMVGHLLHYHPAAHRLIAEAHAGRMGEIKHIYSRRFGLGRLRTEEDVIWSFAPHDVSLILAILGEKPNYVSTEATSILNHGIVDIANIHLGFPSGSTARISVSWLNPVKEQRMVLIGSEAHAIFDDILPWGQKLQVFDHRIDFEAEAPHVTSAEPKSLMVTACEPLREEFSHFLACISSGQRPMTDGREGLEVLRVLEAADRSKNARKG